MPEPADGAATSVFVDRDACISAGRCVDDAPEAFAFDGEQLSTVLPGAARLGSERLLAVARACPVGAIRLTAPDGTEVPLD
jgi:ferredoxin